MKLIKSDYWPFYEKIQMQKCKQVINIASLLLKKDIEINNVKSFFNIPYTKKKHDNLCFDLHFPTNYSAPLPCVFYIHGGAWMSADKKIYTPYCKKLASLGFAVCNINYRLMPEVEVEHCIQDCITAMKFIVNNSTKFNIDPAKLFAIGDSAGAHLVSYAITQFLNNVHKFSKPYKFLGCGLYYGVYDFTKFNKTEFPILKSMHKRYVKLFDKQEKEHLKKQNKSTKNFVSCAKRYKNSDLFQYYKKLSPVNFLTSDFPPVFITSGRIDKLNKQSMLFIKHLNKLNIPYTSLIFPKSRKDASHAFLNIHILPSAKSAYEHLVRFFFAQLNP